MTTEKVYSLADIPEWKAEQETLIELQHKLLANEKEQAGLSALELPEGQRTDEITRQAIALLDGDAGYDAEAAKSRRAELRKEVSVLRRAVEMQQRRILDLRTNLSAVVCKPLIPEHRERVKDIVECARALAMANEAEAALRRKLELGDVSYLPYLKPMAYKRVGSLDDDNSDINRYLKECIEFGYLPASKDTKVA